MASIVTDVLKNSGLLEKDDLSTRINKIASRLDDTKAFVYRYIQDKYVEFKPNLNRTLDLHGRVKILSSDMQSLSDKIKGEISNQLNSSTSDLHDITKQMEKTNALVDMLEILCQVQDDMEQFQNALEAKDYLKASKHMDKTRQSVRTLVKDGYCDIKIIKALDAELRIHQETLIYDLGETWTSNLKWSLPPAKEAICRNNIEQVKLTIGHNKNFCSTLQAMEYAGMLKPKLQTFGKRLQEYIFTMLTTLPGCSVVVTETKSDVVLSLKCKKSNQKHSDPIAVYKNIHIVLETIRSPLLAAEIKTAEHDGIKVSTILGCLVWKDIADSLISTCLVHSIPTTSSQLEQYKSVIEATETFEKYLLEIGFIHEQTSPLLSYARNINLHFANRKCQEITVRARDLMKKELHNTVYVGKEQKEEEEEKEDEKTDKKKESEKHLGDGILQFPRCAISESVQQLINLAYETLQDAVTDTPQCAIQLFYTVRNMLEFFCDIVPTYHRDNIEKLPQVSAIHHNNCMYISHYLMTLGHQYSKSLPPPLKQGAATFVDLIQVFRKLAAESFLAQMLGFRHTAHNLMTLGHQCSKSLPQPLRQGAATFVDLIQVFRKLAAESFLAQMRTQRSRLLESLAEASNFDRVAEDSNKTITEKAIKKTLHQMTHLQKVWGTVLPACVYTKAMATLANTILIHIVENITALEDISADDAHTLYSLLSVLQVELPALLHPTEDSQVRGVIEVQVETWMSFKELLFILEASLQDIVDRWADGKGPLALAFSPTEIKAMIRALFQNTDRRAAALSKIRKS